MSNLWFYNLIGRVGVRNYRAKNMLMAFIGTHIALLALVSHFALKASRSNRRSAFGRAWASVNMQVFFRVSKENVLVFTES